LLLHAHVTCPYTLKAGRWETAVCHSLERVLVHTQRQWQQTNLAALPQGQPCSALPQGQPCSACTRSVENTHHHITHCFHFRYQYEIVYLSSVSSIQCIRCMQMQTIRVILGNFFRSLLSSTSRLSAFLGLPLGWAPS